MAATLLDPLDQFEDMSPERRVEWLKSVCIAQQMELNALKLQVETTRGVVGRLKTVIEEAAALAILRWKG